MSDVTLTYRCAICCPAGRNIQVIERRDDETEDEWMRVASASAVQDHWAHSPTCPSDDLNLQITERTATDGPTIAIEYSCEGCGLTHRPVEVRERGAAEDLQDWLEVVKSRIGLDHAQASAACTSAEVSLRFHVTNARIGTVTRQ